MHYLYLLRTYPRYLAYGLLHYFFSGPGQSFFLSLYVTYFLVVLGADNNGPFDWIYAGATLLGAFVLPWVGSLLDRVKLRYFSLGLGLGYAAFCVLASQVSNAYLLFAALFGLRLCGQGLMGLTAATATARYFTKMRGQALSLVSFGVSIAEIVLPLLIVALLGWLDWRTTWLLTAAAILLIFIPSVLTLVPKDSPFQSQPEEESETADQPVSVPLWEVLRRPSFYLLSLVYLWVPFFMTGIVINKNLLGEANGWSEAWLAVGLSLFGATRLLANLVSGPLIDRFTARRVFSFMLFPQIIAVLLLPLSDHPAMMVVFFLLSGISASLNSLTSTAAWAELYGTRHLGAIRSITSTGMVFATALAPVILGWALEDPSNEAPTMLTAAAIMGGLTGLAFWQVKRLA
jgi:MFS family permease